LLRSINKRLSTSSEFVSSYLSLMFPWQGEDSEAAGVYHLRMKLVNSVRSRLCMALTYLDVETRRSYSSWTVINTLLGPPCISHSRSLHWKRDRQVPALPSDTLNDGSSNTGSAKNKLRAKTECVNILLVASFNLSCVTRSCLFVGSICTN